MAKLKIKPKAPKAKPNIVVAAPKTFASSSAS